MSLFDGITKIFKSGVDIYSTYQGGKIAETNAQANLEAARAANKQAEAQIAAINAQGVQGAGNVDQQALMNLIQATQGQINNVADNMPSPNISGEVPAQPSGFGVSPILIGGAILAYYALKGN